MKALFRNRSSHLLPAAGALLCILAAHSAVAADAPWPNYRGPGYDGRSSETGLALSWGESGPPELWRAELGDGYSGMTVAHGKVYTMYGAGGDEILAAFDAESGRQVWRLRVDANRRDPMGGGPRSTPTADGSRVYALGAMGQLVAVDAERGTPVWQLDLKAAYGARPPQWGVSTSPVVAGELLLLDVGGRSGYSLVALDKASGKLRWHSQTDEAGYSTPLVVTAAGRKQVLFFTASALVSVALDDGALNWRYPWKTSYDVNAAMPVFIPPDKVLISSSYDVGAAVLGIRATQRGLEVQEVWKSRVLKNHFNSSVLVDGVLYGFDDGTLKAIDPSGGEEHWRQRGFAKGSLIYADGHLIIFGERGQLAVAEATPEAYRERSSAQVFNAKTWTMPTLADGRLFLRSERELVALDLRPAKTREAQ
jgi:outer membrane protein assembly factor BamB